MNISAQLAGHPDVGMDAPIAHAEVPVAAGNAQVDFDPVAGLPVDYAHFAGCDFPAFGGNARLDFMAVPGFYGDAAVIEIHAQVGPAGERELLAPLVGEADGGGQGK